VATSSSVYCSCSQTHAAGAPAVLVKQGPRCSNMTYLCVSQFTALVGLCRSQDLPGTSPKQVSRHTLCDTGSGAEILHHPQC
jgi:hypothetical protein